MSHLFQRPLCEMGRAYDFAFRPAAGSPADEDGGPCDDRPHSVELYAADADRSKSDAAYRAFFVCPVHESQLRRYDVQLRERGVPPRFRWASGESVPAGRAP